MLAWMQTNWPVIVSVLLGLSEVLALIPGIKANSVFQLIVNGLKAIAPKSEPPALK
jgi:hypothetical protein